MTGQKKRVHILSEIVCVINYVTFGWMMCDFMQLAMLHFEMRLLKYIRVGITILKKFIWGGISSDIWLEIYFYGNAHASP